MAKEKPSANDLEAELAALEAELAALEGKKAKPKATQDAARAEPKKPRFALPKRDKEAAPAEAAPEAKSKKGFAFGRKKADTAVPAPAPSAPTPAATPEPAPVAVPIAAPARTYDATLWRHEDGAWVRRVPGAEPDVRRRILDEHDALVREEPATRADLDEVHGVKAERGVGRLFGRRSK